MFTGYDPLTGEVKREFPPDVHVHWFHHRCYPAKATGNYLLTARNGTEFVDLKSGELEAAITGSAADASTASCPATA